MIDVLNSDASSPIQKLHELLVIIEIAERCGSDGDWHDHLGRRRFVA